MTESDLAASFNEHLMARFGSGLAPPGQGAELHRAFVAGVVLIASMSSPRSAETLESCRDHLAVLDSDDEANRLCNGRCFIDLACRQVGPDGDVPGNARECAELWEREASRLLGELERFKAIVRLQANQ